MSQKNIDMIIDYCQDEKALVFEEAQYSYAQLEEVYDYVCQVSPNNMVSLYIDETENAVKMGVSNSVAPSTSTMGVALLSLLPIEVEYEEPASIEVELFGGTVLRGYTLGACGTYQSKPLFS